MNLHAFTLPIVCLVAASGASAQSERDVVTYHYSQNGTGTMYVVNGPHSKVAKGPIVLELETARTKTRDRCALRAVEDIKERTTTQPIRAEMRVVDNDGKQTGESFEMIFNSLSADVRAPRLQDTTCTVGGSFEGRWLRTENPAPRD